MVSRPVARFERRAPCLPRPLTVTASLITDIISEPHGAYYSPVRLTNDTRVTSVNEGGKRGQLMYRLMYGVRD